MNAGVIYLLLWLTAIAIGYGIEQYKKQRYLEQHGSLEYEQECQFLCKPVPWKEHWIFVSLLVLVLSPFMLGYFCNLRAGLLSIVAPVGAGLFLFLFGSDAPMWIVPVAMLFSVVQIVALFMTKCKVSLNQHSIN